MGLVIAALFFVVSSLTVTHVAHLHEQNSQLSQKVQVLETQADINNLQIDGVPVRNLSNENE